MSLDPAIDPSVPVFASDRRSSERLDVTIWTRVAFGEDAEFPFRVSNISTAGLMGMTPCPCAEDAKLRVKLPEIGWVDARVSWRMGDRTGITFRRPLLNDAFLLLSPYCL
jgi:hypothetical protein